MAAAAPPQPRVMVLPFPAQGHVTPLMQLSHRLVDHGFEIDFVNTDYSQARMLAALEAAEGETGAAVLDRRIHLISLPDGMGPDGDRTDILRLGEGLPAAMLGRLEELIRASKTRWLVADISMSWVLDLATTLGVRVAIFLTFSAAVDVLRMHIPKLIEDGIIDEIGNVKRNERIQLSPKMPAMDAADLPWTRFVNSLESRRDVVKSPSESYTLADTVVCNTFQEIESEALAFFPTTKNGERPLAIGPLMATNFTSSASQFWPQDLTCLDWLDAQAPSSVVYVAFGSSTVFDTSTRLQELADGLVLTGRPFLWVVRPNLANNNGGGWLDEFRRSVGGKGMVVGWAPQQRVLSHPAVACFVTHCGWNSTMEGVRHGVPFLCWPYFADQFLNQNYICDVWGTGIKIHADEKGVVTKEEIRAKVARLLGDEAIRERALSLKSRACAAIADGGPSHQDLLKFVNLLREQ